MRTQPLAPSTLPSLLGDTVLVELVELDGDLHVVTVRKSGFRLHCVGSAEAAADEVDYSATDGHGQHRGHRRHGQR